MRQAAACTGNFGCAPPPRVKALSISLSPLLGFETSLSALKGLTDFYSQVSKGLQAFPEDRLVL